MACVLSLIASSSVVEDYSSTILFLKIECSLRVVIVALLGISITKIFWNISLSTTSYFLFLK
jgi:hypothetical protein